MSVNLLEKRRIANPKRFHDPLTVLDGRRRRELIHRLPLPSVTDEEEMKFVTRAAMWMVILGVTPMILFYILNFFYPDLLLIPITPN